jgi:hypothetical protein
MMRPQAGLPAWNLARAPFSMPNLCRVEQGDPSRSRSLRGSSRLLQPITDGDTSTLISASDSYEAKILDYNHNVFHLLRYLRVVMCLVDP